MYAELNQSKSFLQTCSDITIAIGVTAILTASLWLPAIGWIKGLKD